MRKATHEGSESSHVPPEAQDASSPPLVDKSVLYTKFRGLERHVKSSSEQEKMSQLDALYLEITSEGIENKQAQKPNNDELKNQLADLKELLGQNLEREREAAQIRMINFIYEHNDLEKKIQNYNDRLLEFEKSFDDRLKDDVDVKKTCLLIRERINAMKQNLEEVLPRKSAEAFLTHWILKLRGYKRDYEKNGIVETDDIEKMADDVREEMKKKLRVTGKIGVATLLGETGTGKTTVARKIASELSPEGYEFVSAHHRMTADDLIERLGINVKKIDANDVPALIKEAQKKYRQENPDFTPKDLDAIDIEIAEVIKGQSQQVTMTTEMIDQAVKRAAKEGKIVIIDEFNYLPEETLASLNALMDTKPGNGVKEGFGIILTGNIGKRFKRQKLGAAFLNRISHGIIEYNFPPQEFNNSLEKSIVTEEQLGKDKNSPPKRSLFTDVMAIAIDKKSNLVGPPNMLEDAWNVSRSFSLIQQIAMEKDYRDLRLPDTFGQVSTGFQFDDSMLSFRQLNAIVEEWKHDAYQYSLDWYIYKNVIRPAVVIAPKEAAQLFFVFKEFGQFFQSDAWKGIQITPSPWSINGFHTLPEKNMLRSNAPMKHFLPEELVTAVSGRELPRRHDINTEHVDTDSETLQMEMEGEFLKRQEQLKNLSEMVELVCPLKSEQTV